MKFSIYLNRRCFRNAPNAASDQGLHCVPNIQQYCRHINRYNDVHVQSNLDGSNTDGSFTMANSNSFLSPYAIPFR